MAQDHIMSRDGAEIKTRVFPIRIHASPSAIIEAPDITVVTCDVQSTFPITFIKGNDPSKITAPCIGHNRHSMHRLAPAPVYSYIVYCSPSFKGFR